MTTRRRSDDNVRLYDFAKKYQENQNSSDLVKKQNAAEEKVLTARLEYLKNQKELTKKTLEKEIDLVRRNSSSSVREAYHKTVGSSVSLPNMSDCARESRSAGGRMDRASPHCYSKARMIWGMNSRNDCGKTGSAMQPLGHGQNQDDVLFDERKKRILNSTHVSTLPLADKHRLLQQSSCPILKSNSSGSKTGVAHETTMPLKSRSTNDSNERHKYSQPAHNYSQALQARRQEWMRTCTPFPKLENGKDMSKTSLVEPDTTLTDARNEQLRFSRTMSDLSNLTLRNTKYSPTGGAVKDLRFKNLESVLVHIKP